MLLCHRAGARGREHPRAVRGESAREMHAGEREHVADARGDHARPAPSTAASIQVVVGTGSSPGSWTCPTAVRCSNASSGSVTVPSSPSGSIRRSRSARSHVSAGEVLHDPAGEDVPGVAVGERRAERMVLYDVLHARDVALDALVAPPGVGEDVAVDPARVGEEVTRRDLLRDGRVRHPEVGQHLRDRGVEVERALVDELHDERRRPDLRDRADLEQRIRRHRHVRGRAENTGGRLGDRPVVEHTERRARHAVPVASAPSGAPARRRRRTSPRARNGRTASTSAVAYAP